MSVARSYKVYSIIIKKNFLSFLSYLSVVKALKGKL